jgi:DNA-binding phage protein
MNYAEFAGYVRDVAATLEVRFGVPAYDAEDIAKYLEHRAVQAAAKVSELNQFVIRYRSVGPVALARETGLHRETLRRHFNAANAAKSPQECGT